MKYAANIITALRIPLSLAILLTEPFSVMFCAMYILCGISDIADGYIARKLHSESKTGEALDSVADLVFVTVMLTILIPLLPWKKYIIIWCAIIAALKIVSAVTGLVRFGKLSFLHTYLNKLTGTLLFLFPLVIGFAGFDAASVALCAVASLSAAEEYAILISTKQLDRNIKGIFIK